jgi:hypothetical protein
MSGSGRYLKGRDHCVLENILNGECMKELKKTVAIVEGLLSISIDITLALF